MKAFLMHRDADFDLERELPPNVEDLTRDLELGQLLDAMGGEDPFLVDVARIGLLSSLQEPESIAYRQSVLRDCMDHPDVVRAMYDLAVETITRERKEHWGLLSESAELVLHRGINTLGLYVEMLTRLRQFADEHATAFQSEGFSRLFAELQAELTDEYFDEISEHLRELRFKQGALISAGLGQGLKPRRFVLRRPRKQRWRDKLPIGERTSYSFQIADRDEAGARMLSELRARGITLVANALGQSSDHILSYFKMLRAELGFYVGCLNLHDRLAAKDEPVCFPEALPAGAPVLAAGGLYDVCLTLGVEDRVVGNEVRAEGKRLVVITGANQGGKSTLLRSVGLAQLMMQAGMFVGAESLRADVRNAVFTHFKREEDETMESGKLDEEIRRMSGVVEHLRGGGMLLCNESFASTNEREGSEIARQIVRALLEAGIKVWFVTHMYDLAHGFYTRGEEDALFLRAERRPDGTRTFRLLEGEPLPTSYGEDLYRRIFGVEPAAALR